MQLSPTKNIQACKILFTAGENNTNTIVVNSVVVLVSDNVSIVIFTTISIVIIIAHAYRNH